MTALFLASLLSNPSLNNSSIIFLIFLEIVLVGIFVFFPPTTKSLADKSVI
jgi:hypothetical protein